MKPILLEFTLPLIGQITFPAYFTMLTLGLMLGATVIFMPLIIFYTRWAYQVMAGKVTADYIREHSHSAY